MTPTTRTPLTCRSLGVAILPLLLILWVVNPVSRASAQPASLDYDKGFVMRAGDKSLKIGGYLQTWHQSLVDDEGLSTNEFRIVRARIGAKASLAPWLSFRVVSDLTKSTVLLDCYFDAKIAPWAKLRVGQMKVPFVRQAFLSDSAQEFVGVSMATKDYKLPRDLGVMFMGSFADGLFELQLAGLNGAGTNARQDNTDMLWVARVVAHPLGATPMIEAELTGQSPLRASIGASGTYNRVTEIREAAAGGLGALAGGSAAGASGGASLGGLGGLMALETVTDRAMAAGELTLLWRGFHLGLEGMMRHDEVEGGEDPDRVGVGGYVQTSYMVLPPYLQLGLRGAMLRADVGVTDADRFEAAGVLSGYIDGHRLKLQLEYAALLQELPGLDQEQQHRVLLQVQAKF
jgi:hypothetical protein